MRALRRPALSMAERMAFRSGGWVNLTSTTVPPRNSTPNGTPCQKTMLRTPATLKISEKARKYHLYFRKRIFGLRKNSIDSYSVGSRQSTVDSHFLLRFRSSQRQR